MTVMVYADFKSLFPKSMKISPIVGFGYILSPDNKFSLILVAKETFRVIFLVYYKPDLLLT